MQVLIGRVTADAKVTSVKDDRLVVNFSIAINDRYKPKDGEVVKLTTFVNCSYWVNPAIAPYLKKGTLVELAGRLGVNAYNDMNGEAKAAITLHVNNIKIHGGPKQEHTETATPESNQSKKKSGTKNKKTTSAEEVTEPIDDLPF